jgi:hypothetical protein
MTAVRTNAVPTTMRYPTRFQQQTLWNAATGVSILIMGVLLVGIVWLIGNIFSFLQPVLVPLLVAAIVAYVLDPVVRLLEKRGVSRLWSVVIVFVTILICTTLLVAAVLPGIQRGHKTLKTMLTSKQQTESTTQTTTPDASDEAAQTRRLGNTLALELEHLRKNNADNLIGWLLTETDDEGNAVTPRVKETDDKNKAVDPPVVVDDKDKAMVPPVPQTDDKDKAAAPPKPAQAVTLDTFANSRAGRMLFEYKGVIFKTSRDWLTAGSTKSR